MTTHKHHKVPKHRGGTDDPSNIVEVSVEQHAELHLAEYLTYGLVEDWLAYRGLSGIITHEEAVSEAQSNAVSKANKTRVWTDEGRSKLAAACVKRAIPVYCPELDRTWEGGYMEASRELGIQAECIRMVCKGKRKTAGKLTFRQVT